MEIEIYKIFFEIEKNSVNCINDAFMTSHSIIDISRIKLGRDLIFYLVIDIEQQI